ncbi:MAG: hypothetical protein RMK01_11615 [Thermomicrobium sp.]|nr:hypothetical protein [Thermomicrobium sp.]
MTRTSTQLRQLVTLDPSPHQYIQCSSLHNTDPTKGDLARTGCIRVQQPAAATAKSPIPELVEPVSITA